MYSHAVWALAALMLWFASPAQAFSPEFGAEEPEPVDRAVNFRAADVDIRSFYKRRLEDDANQNDPLQQQLWGFTADSSLPVSAAHAQLEYSVWMPDGRGRNASDGEQNRMVRLRLNDHHRYFDYGANLFSVGDAFVHNPLGQERLDAAGLPGPGDGTELWLSGRVPKLGVRPRYRRLAKTQGAAELINETFGLTFDHGLGGKSRLMYLLESTDVSTWFEDAATGNVRESAMATVRMQSPWWNVYVKNAVFDHAFDSRAGESGSLWEVGGTLNVVRGLTLTPLLMEQVRDVGAADLRASSAGLTLHTTWIDPVDLNVNVQCNRQENLDGSLFQRTAANLNLRTPVRLWKHTPAKLMMTATLGYRGMAGLANPAPEEGVSFQLTFDFNPGL